MFYLKIKDGKVIEAPKNCIRKGFQVFGYNKNQKMLKEDGFLPFDFPVSQAEIIEGKIVKKEIKPVEKTVYTKLEIRRACRELKLENKLNALLAANSLFAADWADAQEIDLSDPILLQALAGGAFTAQEIADLKNLMG